MYPRLLSVGPECYMQSANSFGAEAAQADLHIQICFSDAFGSPSVAQNLARGIVVCVCFAAGDRLGVLYQPNQ